MNEPALLCMINIVQSKRFRNNLTKAQFIANWHWQVQNTYVAKTSHSLSVLSSEPDASDFPDGFRRGTYGISTHLCLTTMRHIEMHK